MMGPEAAYGIHGADMFAGYYVILAFPLMVIVPFGAFRSLAGEQEDRTYELLSITGLSPRQIVGGKLGSAVLQMLIYLSAISPCLAFTYMLRGVSFPSILFAVFWLVLTSLAFSVIGLLVGTLTSEKHWQVVLSVLLIVALFLAFWFACVPDVWRAHLVRGAVRQIRSSGMAMAALLTGYVSYFALVFYAAVARITFDSDNRSTRLRVIMFAAVRPVCRLDGLGWSSPRIRTRRRWLVFLSFVGVHWYVMGAIDDGRVARCRPASGGPCPRASWAGCSSRGSIPARARGYMFAVCGSLSALVMAGRRRGARERRCERAEGRGPCAIDDVLGFGGRCFTCYTVIYLGLGLLVIRFLRRFGLSGLLVALLVHVVLLAIGTGVPLVIQMTSIALRSSRLQSAADLQPVLDAGGNRRPQQTAAGRAGAVGAASDRGGQSCS